MLIGPQQWQQCQKTQQQRQETQQQRQETQQQCQKLDASPQECAEPVGSLDWALAMALEKEKEKAATVARWGVIFAVRKSHPLLHRQTGLLLPQCPHQVANNKGVTGTPTTVVLTLVTQSAAVAQRVSPCVKGESLTQETKLAIYTAQSTAFA